ncbi:hypothetical protein GCM10025867_48370 (plasmid) [Frondihabitans sucicola]|uniref:Tyr recombinase domain-containing protein n=1 Tax=Frondihabitans sucicola TaxID=1268041 RepID=A0ABM8GVU7_9MICO|nr:tyrosine-type recombinase/integrase [Frondihabitans sucicola]BDZ50499.1 hypothetical protein GCM10025867_27400 [Frondihabitans sucicola]BDZ52596.1 hypothetical protein GCM10025867_48370 [Frondihabitans sucicola]
MDGEFPGFVPKVLLDPSIALFRAEDRVFEAMVDGWTSEMLARGNQVSTIKDRVSLLRRFQSFTNDYPWMWGPGDINEFAAERLSGERPIKPTTLRTDSNTIAMFCSYVSNPAYGWVAFCERTFDSIPSQIVFEWNSPHHSADDAVPTGKRAFTKPELQLIFDYVDDLADSEYARGSKRWPNLLRDSNAFKICYAYGLRRRELTMLDTVDFGPNPYVPDYGMFGALTVRWAKGVKGSGPRRRTVLTVPEFDWVVELADKWISSERRGRFSHADGSLALWPSERGNRISLGTLGDAFTAARRAVGLPEDLGLHCLRHSYVTHLLEAKYDPLFVQQQVGHAYASTTSLYTSVSDNFKQRAVQEMIAARVPAKTETAHA